jgi:type IV pilus assembly protein PilA
MIHALRQRIDRELEGFTLIELMVVVLIIAILIAIAIPTFLGAQDRARDRAAQSNVRNALTAAKTIATDHDGAYVVTLARGAAVAIRAADLRAAEGAILFVDGAARLTSGKVYVSTSLTGSTILLTAFSKSRNFWSLSATDSGLVKYCPATTTAPLARTICTGLRW